MRNFGGMGDLGKIMKQAQQMQEKLLEAQSQLGSVEVVDFTSVEGHARFGIAVDVQPFPSPLIVRVGYAMFGLQAAFDRAGTIAVAEAARAKRPVAVTP